jgi:hypothetical protein
MFKYNCEKSISLGSTSWSWLIIVKYKKKNKVHKESHTWIKKFKSNQVICFYNLNKDMVILMIRILPQLDDINK